MCEIYRAQRAMGASVPARPTHPHRPVRLRRASSRVPGARASGAPPISVQRKLAHGPGEPPAAGCARRRPAPPAPSSEMMVTMLPPLRLKQVGCCLAACTARATSAAKNQHSERRGASARRLLLRHPWLIAAAPCVWSGCACAGSRPRSPRPARAAQRRLLERHHAAEYTRFSV